MSDYPTEPEEWRQMAANATRDSFYLAPIHNFTTLAADALNSSVYFYFITQMPSEELMSNGWGECC